MLSTCDAGLASNVTAAPVRVYDLENCEGGIMDSEEQTNKVFEVDFESGIERIASSRPRASAPEKEFEDSWALDDLYCEVSQYSDEDAEDQMITLEDKQDILSWAVSLISASPTGRAMLNEALENGWAVSLEDLCGIDYHLDIPEKRIVLDNNGLLESALGASEYFRNVMLVALVRGLRDVWQEKRHGAFEDYDAESALKLERVRAADLDIMAVLVAWELRSEGVAGLWRHMIGSDEGDIAMRFSAYLERDPRSLFSGKALQEAFVQWFRSEERVRKADHETLNAMDYAIEEYGREAYGSEKLTPVRLEVLSCLPDKTAYLQGLGRDVMMDPLYAGLNDTINQAHFFQIIYDLKVTRVHGIPFQNADLAEKIFPGGEFTAVPDELKN